MGNPASTPSASDVGRLPGRTTDVGRSPSDQTGVGLARQNARARQRADTRERIFETAVREFRDVGLAAAQIDRIAKNAGIARGTFYFHFPTKDAVLVELARRINTRVARRIGMIAESKPDLQDFLLRLSDALIDEHNRVSEAGLQAAILAIYLRLPAELSKSLQDVPTLTDVLVGQLRVLTKEAGLPPGLSIEQLSPIIMSSLVGILARVPPGEPVRRACRTLIELLVRGLRASA